MEEEVVNGPFPEEVEDYFSSIEATNWNLFYCADLADDDQWEFIYRDWQYHSVPPKRPAQRFSPKDLGELLFQLSTDDNNGNPVPRRPREEDSGIMDDHIALNVLFSDAIGVLSETNRAEMRTHFSSCFPENEKSNLRTIDSQSISRIVFGLAQLHPDEDLSVAAANYPDDRHHIEINLAVTMIELLHRNIVRISYSRRYSFYSLFVDVEVEACRDITWSTCLDGSMLSSIVSTHSTKTHSVLGTSYYINSNLNYRYQLPANFAQNCMFVVVKAQAALNNGKARRDFIVHIVCIPSLDKVIAPGSELRWRYNYGEPEDDIAFIYPEGKVTEDFLVRVVKDINDTEQDLNIRRVERRNILNELNEFPAQDDPLDP